MTKLKLTYFDFHGGRGEPARLALSIRGIAIEDDRVAPSDLPARKANAPFGALPGARSGRTDCLAVQCYQSLCWQARKSLPL